MTTNSASLSPTEPWWVRHMLLFGMLGLMLLLRGPWLFREAMFCDEGWTHMRVMQPLQDTLQTEPEPLNTVIGKTFLESTRWTGVSEKTLLRLPQFIFSMATLALVLWWTHSLAGPMAALLAGLLLVFSPQFAAQSVICRYYPLLTLISLALCASMAHNCLSPANRGGWAATVLLLLLGALTHASFPPFAACVAAGCGVGLLVDRNRPSQQRWRTLWGLSASGLAFLLLLAPLHFERIYRIVAGVLRITNNNPSRQPWPRYQLDLEQYHGFVFGNTGLLPLPGVLLSGLALLLMVLGFVHLWRRQRVLGCMFAGALLFPAPFFFVETGHYWAARYFISLLPVYVMLLCCGAALPFRLLDGRPHARRLQVLCGVILVAVFGAWRIAAERHEVVEGIRDPLTTFCAGMHDKVAPSPEPLICVPERLEKFRTFCLVNYLNSLSGIFPEDNPKGYCTTRPPESGLITLLLARKTLPAWVVLPNKDTAGEAFQTAMDGVHQDLAYCGATLEHAQAGYELWRYQKPAEARMLWFEEGDFTPETPGMSLAEGAQVQATPDPLHGPVVALNVPGDAPLKIEEGHPCPTVWFNKTLPPGLRAAIQKCAKPPLYVLHFDVKYKEYHAGENPSRTLRAMVREGKKWNGYAVMYGHPLPNDEAGKRQWSGWERRGATFRGGVDVLINPPKTLVFGVGNRGGYGDMQIDNVRVDIVFHPDDFTAAGLSR